MSGLVRIHLGGAIQRIGRFCIVAHAAIQIKELEQSLAIVAFSIRCVELLAHELEQFGGRAVPRRDVLNHRQESPTISLAAMVLLQLPSQGNGFGVLLGIDEEPDQVRDLLHARRIFLEQLPLDRLSVGEAIGSLQRFARRCRATPLKKSPH